MHIYFVGIGGTGIGPLACIAAQAGHQVCGSDRLASQYTDYLKKKHIPVYIGQTGNDIARVHDKHKIDWVVSVSAITRNNPDHPELQFARQHHIPISERDECLNKILTDNQLSMIAVAGTHGKTTTTAMIVWLCRQIGLDISWSVGAKMSFADMGHYQAGSKYFIYECDEFHRNFLHFHPHLAAISGISWDHHEVYPTKTEYDQAFRDFIDQTEHCILWNEDAISLKLPDSKKIITEDYDNKQLQRLSLNGLYNRRDAWLAIKIVHRLTKKSIDELLIHINSFPGVQRRMEQLRPGLYTDYAHTPDKIRGCISVASEIAARSRQKIVVVYEPLTNRRQHFMKDDYQNCFDGAAKVYWLPSYLAREDPKQPILEPAELIKRLNKPEIAVPQERDESFWLKILNHLADGDLVVCMSGGGGNSLDEWLRAHVKSDYNRRDIITR